MWWERQPMQPPTSTTLNAAGSPCTTSPVRIGLALGGGFARGMAHAGVLGVFERYQIPIHCVTGVSAGAVAAAAFASGATAEEISRVASSMRFADVGRWRPGPLGLVSSDCMRRLLGRLLKTDRFAKMRTPLGVLATILSDGEPACFFGTGDVFEPVRASCAFPGLFQPVRHQGQLLVDGAMSTSVPAALARQLGATHVISVSLPPPVPHEAPRNVLQVVGRCFQLLQSRAEESWRAATDLVIAPDVRGIDWRAFDLASQAIRAGEAAAMAALPEIQNWLAAARSFCSSRVVNVVAGQECQARAL